LLTTITISTAQAGAVVNRTAPTSNEMSLFIVIPYVFACSQQYFPITTLVREYRRKNAER
jgi:hypothetical protein